MTDLNNTQQSELEALAEESRAARARAAQRAQAYVNKERQIHKENVSPSEYLTRLNRSMMKDTVIVKEAKAARVKNSLANWKEKVGPTFAEATTDNPKINERVARLKDDQGRHKTSLILQGNLGTGKTWLSYAFINLAISSGAVTAGQILADTEISAISSTVSAGYKKAEMFEELLNPRYQIYFIDDVGQGFFNDIEKRHEVWFNLINHVYTHQLTLLITTNLALTDAGLGRHLGKRAYDRLKSLVGPDGVMEPGKVNRREGVLEERERAYHEHH